MKPEQCLWEKQLVSDSQKHSPWGKLKSTVLPMLLIPSLHVQGLCLAHKPYPTPPPTVELAKTSVSCLILLLIY